MASVAEVQPGGRGGWEGVLAVADGPRGTLRKSRESEREVERGVEFQRGFSGRWRVFWICFGPVGVAVVGVEALIVGFESVEAGSSFTGDLESMLAEVLGRLDIRNPISSLSHSWRSYG